VRAVLAAVLATMVIAGCGHGRLTDDASRAGTLAMSPIAPPTAVASVVQSSLGDNIPPDDLSFPRRDRAGNVPGDMVLALIDARQRHDWSAAYALTAKPSSTYATAVKEWSQADEHLTDVAILETRVIGAGKGKGDAFVRVRFAGETTSPTGERYSVGTGPQGTWWLVVKDHGLWRVNWSQ